MRKFLKLFVILIVSLMVMVACSNGDTTTEDSGNSDNDSTSETSSTENDDADEDSDQEDVEKDNSDSSNSDTDDGVPVLALGETGVIEDNLGTYEITPTSFKLVEELSDGDHVETTMNGKLIVVDISIKNIGEESLELEDVAKADLYVDGAGVSSFDDYPNIEKFEGKIAQGESESGQIVFDLFVADYYELAFGANMPTYISNEVRWALHAEDAE